jgi:dTDP-4-dehydrorhamnose 3,5-epimerase
VIFTPLPVAGAFAVDPERVADERGFFARTWCAEAFAARGLPAGFAQCSVSFNRLAGTLRGMHVQAAPHGEAKLARCTRGAAYDVLLDLRPGSPTRGRWTAQELTAENGRAVFIPEGVAHGFQTLADDTELFYQIAGAYRPEAARGVRWDDPAFAIAWPRPVACISARDRAWPAYAPAREGAP